MKPIFSLFILVVFALNLSAQSSNLEPSSFFTTGSATPSGDNCFQLTPPIVWQGGAVWFKKPISLSDPFEMEVDLFFGCDDNGADGMVFIFHPKLKDGFQGEGIGFGGLSPAFGIEMDTYENPHLGDPYFDHLTLIKNGEMHHDLAISRPVALLANKRNIEDCKNHRVKITWEPSLKNLKIFIDGSLRLNKNYDIVRNIFEGDPIVYWGISSATGGEYNQHKVCLEKLEFSSPDFFENYITKLLLDKQHYTLQNVAFLSGKTEFETPSVKELDKLVNFMKAHPKYILNISGHTDNVGSETRNRTISQKRANAVKRYLIKKGINKERIKSIGYGEKYPKVDNTTPENRKANRRVEVHVSLPDRA